jgi:iron complex outermembrane receptor protein
LIGSVTGARASDWMNYDRIRLADAVVHGQVPATPDALGPWLSGFWRNYSGVTRVRAALAREITPSLTLTATGDNLLGYQRGEPDNITIVPGRTLTLGIRASF